jgi:PAS domain S-box-containing protein
MQQQYTVLTWIRKDGHLNYVDDKVEHLLGWTVEEIKAMPLTRLMTGASYSKLKKSYLVGSPGTIMPRVLELGMRHKDGHTIEMRLSVVCRYDDRGQLTEAYGSVRPTSQRQEEQDELVTWWETARPEALDALIHTAKMIYATV